MKRWIIGIIVGIGIVLLIGFYIKLADFSPKVTNEELIKKIEQLESKIDSLNNSKDSLRQVVDSTHVKIITNEKHYKERIDTIIHQSSSADSCFITDYIRFYSEQNPLSNFE